MWNFIFIVNMQSTDKVYFLSAKRNARFKHKNEMLQVDRILIFSLNF